MLLFSLFNLYSSNLGYERKPKRKTKPQKSWTSATPKTNHQLPQKPKIPHNHQHPKVPSPITPYSFKQQETIVNTLKSLTINTLTISGDKEYPGFFYSLWEHQYKNIDKFCISKFWIFNSELLHLKNNAGDCEVVIRDMHVIDNETRVRKRGVIV